MAMFWFSYTMLHGKLVIMDVTEHQVHGVRCYTACWSEDPRVCATEFSPDLALAHLTSLLGRRLSPVRLAVTFLPQAQHVPA